MKPSHHHREELQKYAKVCKSCKLFDPFYQKHGGSIEGPSHINESERIDFIFITDKLLSFIKACGPTAFNELTTSDHKAFYINILREGIMKRIEINPTSPFTRNVQSNNPQAMASCILVWKLTPSSRISMVLEANHGGVGSLSSLGYVFLRGI